MTASKHMPLPSGVKDVLLDGRVVGTAFWNNGAWRAEVLGLNNRLPNRESLYVWIRAITGTSPLTNALRLRNHVDSAT